MATLEQPTTEAELWDALALHANPCPLAGGTDLLVQMRSGHRQPECIVDIKRLPRFSAISSSDGKIRIGAAVSCRDIALAMADEPGMDAITELCELIGSRQIQNRATFGGNVCNASPAADSVPLLMAMGARYVLVSRDGVRNMPAEDFAMAPGRTVLRPGELLQSIDLPPKPVGTGEAYLRVTPRTEMDIAIASAGARVQIDDSGVCTGMRIAIGGVASKVLLLEEAAQVLVGSELGAGSLEEFARLVRKRADPIDDVRATRDYRRHVIGVLAKRAATRARDRAVASRLRERL